MFYTSLTRASLESQMNSFEAQWGRDLSLTPDGATLTAAVKPKEPDLGFWCQDVPLSLCQHGQIDSTYHTLPSASRYLKISPSSQPLDRGSSLERLFAH